VADEADIREAHRVEHEQKRRERHARLKVDNYLRLYLAALKMAGDPDAVLKRVRQILEN
jgi:hypothetical protein